MQRSKRIRILLGDPRHSTIGLHSTYLPIGIGYIGSYLLSKFGDKTIELRTSIDSQEIFDWCDEWEPDVIALSSYLWNSSLSYRVCEYAKKNNPAILCVLGGPQFPSGTGQANLSNTSEACLGYLQERPALDYYCYSDGEAALPKLMETFFSVDCDLFEMRRQNVHVPGFASLSHDHRELLDGRSVNRIGLEDRIVGRDVIPSPYLTGLLDKYLNGRYIPSWEAARGCPFLCSFCDQGLDSTKIVRFSAERITKELTYVAKRVAHLNGTHSIAFHDSNWGMYKEDGEVAEYLKTLIDDYDWPKWVEISTPKNKKERILSIDKLLNGRVQIDLSQQSMNRETLALIKRNNDTNEQYLKFVKELKKRNKSPICELIIPLPGETEETYRSSVRELLDQGVPTGTYTLMMLPGSELGRPDARQKYSMLSEYRVLPRDVGNYRGKKLFEVDEVCVATNTMSRDEYLSCRRFSYLVELFTNIVFDPLRRYCYEENVSYFKIIEFAFEKLEKENITKNKDDRSFENLYRGFSLEAEAELFPTIELLYEYYGTEKNYEKLLKGEIGDNLLRKYVAKALFESYQSLIDYTFIYAENVFELEGLGDHEPLHDLWKWLKNYYALPAFFGEESMDHMDEISFSHSISIWLENEDLFLRDLRKESTYNFITNKKNILQIIEEMEALFGDEDRLYAVGKYLHQFPSRGLADLSRTPTEVDFNSRTVSLMS